MRRDSEVVREFPALVEINTPRVPNRARIQYVIIGYGPKPEITQPNFDPAKRPLEVYIKADPSYKVGPYLLRKIEENAKKSCGRCHPILNAPINLDKSA